MLIENAFFKIPELMLSNYDNNGRVEAMVVQNLVGGLQMELDCRSVPFSYNHITVEKPYPGQVSSGHYFRADLLFNGSGCIPDTPHLAQYGFREKQWLEAKSFFSKASPPSKTVNIGNILKDIIRLCLLPNELQGHIRQNSRYMLLVFDKKPSVYLAFKGRDWLSSVFEETAPKISIDLSKEGKSLVKSIFNVTSIDAQIELVLSKLQFEPVTGNICSTYWGYLLRIDEFSITINGKSISSGSDPKEYWGSDRIDNLKSVRGEFIGLLKDSK